MHAFAAQLFHRVDGSRGGEAREHKGEPIEGMLLAGAHVLDPEQRQNQGDDADGKVEEEDPVPAGIGGDKAAERRANDQSGETGPGDVGDGLGELVFGRGAQDDEAADRHHHGSANALQDAHQRELGEGVRAPQSRDERVKIAMAAAKTEREPKRSATQPLMGMKTASVSR